MVTDLTHLRQTERWIASVRLGAVLFAVAQVQLSTGYPEGYKKIAWIVTGGLAVGAAVLFYLSRREFPRRQQFGLAVTATETHIAFRAYSQHDLESAFSLGLD